MGLPHSFMTLLTVYALFLFFLCAPFANGAITNTTVDDADPAFTFTGSWTAVSPSNPCDFCSSKPDTSQTFGGTWHDGNYRTGAPEATGGSFTFTGSAVYIFGIDQTQSQPDIAFTLGSIQSVHHYTGTERFVYKSLFFSATGLAADQTHTVTWNFNIDPSTGVAVQAALFDFAIVTSGTEDVPNDQTDISKPPGPTSPATQEAQSKTAPTPSSTQSSTVSAANGAGAQSSSSALSHTLANANSLSGSAIASQSKSSSPSTSTALSAKSSPPASSSPGASGSLSGSDPAPDPDSAISASHHSNIGAIVGAVLGVLAVVILALLAFLLCRRRRRRQCAHEDEERRAAGLPPVAPGMRRVRGGPVLQPFVDDRPLAPAENVFATGAFATASSATADPVSRVSASHPSAPHSSAPAGVSGTSSASPSGAGTDTPPELPPVFVDAAATRDRYPAEKTQDIGYTNPHQAGPSRQPSQSTISNLSRLDTLMSPSDHERREEARDGERETASLTPSTALSPATTSTSPSPSTALSPPPPSDTSTSARERYLEQRLATLEAHVAAYLPPPYEQPEP